MIRDNNRSFVPPQTYYKVFKASEEGQKVLDDLLAHFYHIDAYCKGDSHETSYLNGHRFVLGFILNKIANGEEEPGEQPEQ